MKLGTDCVLVGSALAAGIGLWVFELAEGYFANPALLGMATPLVVIPIAVFCLVIPVVYVLRGIWFRKDRRQVVLAVIALFSLVWRPITPGLPDNLDAFHYRMSRFGEADYDRLLTMAQAELARLEADPIHGRVSARMQGDALYTALAESNPMLTIGPARPNVSVKNDAMSFYWGSGLTGAYFVTVHEDSSDRTCEPTDVSDASCLYGRVALEYVH